MTEGILDPVFDDVGIIDCDAHWTEPADLWTSRAPASIKDRVPQVRQKDGRDFWTMEGDTPIGPVGASVIAPGGEKAFGKLMIEKIEDVDESSYSVPARVDALNKMGITAQILYPNVAGFGSARFSKIEDVNLRNTCVSIYNDAMAEVQEQSRGRLYPQAILPFWDLDATLAEIRRIKEMGMSGLTIPDQPEILDQPDYTDEHWTPFWELVAETGLPLNFHIASADITSLGNAAWKGLGRERKLCVTAMMAYLGNARVVTNLLYADVIEKYPTIKFVSVESGIGWIPFVLEAAEYQWDEMCPTEVKHHKMRPTEKFRNSIYACFWFEKHGPETLIDHIGADNVLFETDYPHPTCLYPGARDHLREVMNGLSDETRRKVLWENASKLYGIS